MYIDYSNMWKLMAEKGLSKSDLMELTGLSSRIIAKLAKNIPSDGSEEIDASGKHVFPGLIDMHVHLREPGFEKKEDCENMYSTFL